MTLVRQMHGLRRPDPFMPSFFPYYQENLEYKRDFSSHLPPAHSNASRDTVSATQCFLPNVTSPGPLCPCGKRAQMDCV